MYREPQLQTPSPASRSAVPTAQSRKVSNAFFTLFSCNYRTRIFTSRQVFIVLARVQLTHSGNLTEAACIVNCFVSNGILADVTLVTSN